MSKTKIIRFERAISGIVGRRFIWSYLALGVVFFIVDFFFVPPPHRDVSFGIMLLLVVPFFLLIAAMWGAQAVKGFAHSQVGTGLWMLCWTAFMVAMSWVVAISAYRILTAHLT